MGGRAERGARKGEERCDVCIETIGTDAEMEFIHK
jgi:hypothetical protein